MNIAIDYDKKTSEYEVTANVVWDLGAQYLIGFEDSSGAAFEDNPRFCVDDTDIECEINRILDDKRAPGFDLTSKEFRQFIKKYLLIVKVVPSEDLKIKFKKKQLNEN